MILWFNIKIKKKKMRFRRLKEIFFDNKFPIYKNNYNK